jgi:hypothetical protein
MSVLDKLLPDFVHEWLGRRFARQEIRDLMFFPRGDELFRDRIAAGRAYYGSTLDGPGSTPFRDGWIKEWAAFGREDVRDGNDRRSIADCFGYEHGFDYEIIRLQRGGWKHEHLKIR